MKYDNSPWAIINSAAVKPKNQKVVMKKVRFATQDKTTKCTFCDLPGTKIQFGKEVRTLCKNHLKKLNAKHEKFDVTTNTFQKASKL